MCLVNGDQNSWSRSGKSSIENIIITIHGRTRGEIKATQFWRVYIDMQLEINHPTNRAGRKMSPYAYPSQPLPEITLDMHAWGVPWSGAGMVGTCKVKPSTVEDPNFPLATSAFNVETTSFAALVSLANIVKYTTTLPRLHKDNRNGSASWTRKNATLLLRD